MLYGTELLKSTEYSPDIRLLNDWAWNSFIWKMATRKTKVPLGFKICSWIVWIIMNILLTILFRAELLVTSRNSFAVTQDEKDSLLFKHRTLYLVSQQWTCPPQDQSCPGNLRVCGQLSACRLFPFHFVFYFVFYFYTFWPVIGDRLVVVCPEVFVPASKSFRPIEL